MKRAHRNTGTRRGDGFTVIEVLAAVTVLSIMMIMLGRLFSDASTAMNLGLTSSDQNSEARAAIDFMAKELSMAVFDEEHLKFRADLDGGKLWFVALSGVVTNDYRKAAQLHYQIKSWAGSADSETDTYTRDGLFRDFTGKKGDVNAYDSDWTSASPGQNRLIADHVHDFQMAVCDTNMNVKSSGTYDSNTDGPPIWIEVYLEVLGKTVGRRQGDSDYEETWKQRYFRRVYFHNFAGSTRDRKK